MTSNVTSQAIDTFLACDIDGLGRLTPDDLRAIRLKYKLMEDKLENLRKVAIEASANETNVGSHYLSARCDKALSYDPLSDV